MTKKNIIKKVAATVGVMSLGMSLLAGCGKKKDDDTTTQSTVATNTDGVYVSFDETAVELEELKVFCMITLLDGQILYSNVASEEQIYKDKIIKEIREIKALYKQAIDSNMEFNDEDVETMNGLIAGFKENVSDEAKEKIGITDEVIERVIKEKCYSEKLKTITKNSVGQELNDKYLEEYKDYNFQSIYTMVFPKVKVDDAGNMELDDAGNPVALDEKELEGIRAKAEKASEEINSGKDPKEVAKSNEVDMFSEEKIGIAGQYSAELNDVMASLKEGECSDVMENDNCYYVVTLVKDNDQDYLQFYAYAAAEQNVETEYEARIKSWLEAIGEANVTEAWENFDLVEFAGTLTELGLMLDMAE